MEPRSERRHHSHKFFSSHHRKLKRSISMEGCQYSCSSSTDLSFHTPWTRFAIMYDRLNYSNSTCHRTRINRWRKREFSAWTFVSLLFIFGFCIDPTYSKCYVGEPLAEVAPTFDRSNFQAFTEHDKIISIRECAKRCCMEDTCSLAWYITGTCFTVDCLVRPGICELSNSDGVLSFVARISRDAESDVQSGALFHSRHKDSAGVALSPQPSGTTTSNHTMQGLVENTNSDVIPSNAIQPPPEKKSDQLATPGSFVPPLTSAQAMPVEAQENSSQETTSAPVQSSLADLSRHSSIVPPATPTLPPIAGEGHTNETGKSQTPPTVHVTSASTTVRLITHTPSTLHFAPLTVSGGETKKLQLPQNLVTLHAYVSPKHPPYGGEYHYDWELLQGPENSEKTHMELDGEAFHLTELTEGTYSFKVTVTALSAAGEGYVNVTVLPPPRVNQPPVAIIAPSNNIEMISTSETILDGSQSTDDVGIVSYQWEGVSGPLHEGAISGDTSMLELKDLIAGNYQIKLTVTDGDGESNSTSVNVTVREEADYEPHANAGPDLVIKLPTDTATLNGNQSTDDHGIVKWQWEKIEGGVVDLKGSSKSTLHLTGLQEGTYIFRLNVFDKKEQKGEDTVTVIVKPENNIKPNADAGPDKELSLPDDSTTLEGGKSTDDLRVETYAWKQIKGPQDAEITDADTAEATVTGLVAGTYEFSLTITDGQGASDTDTMEVVVIKEVNNPPVAIAGSDVTIILPINYVELDGSQSSDDKGIVSYEWRRAPDSPASGEFVDKSHHTSILKVVHLVQGAYRFTLNVTDAKGLSKEDSVNVFVKPDPHQLDLVELVFDVNVSAFKEKDKRQILLPLEVLLGVGDQDIILQEITHATSGRLIVIFYALNATSHTALPGVTVLKKLKSKEEKEQTFVYPLVNYDTVVCQKNCSNHGTCHKYTKECMCETFWMENFFRRNLGDGESNCDWSILYVVIILFLSTASVGICTWFTACCLLKKRKKVKRKHKYSLLTEDLEGQESVEMLPKANGKQRSSIMVSESGEDSEDAITVYDGRKKRQRNGLEKKLLNGNISNKRSKRYPGRTEKL